MKKIAVIVPVLNEQHAAEALILRLKAVEAAVQELVVVDGGSSDATANILAQAGFRIIHAEAGRGHALNVGAQATMAEILVFLHADTDLPEGWQHSVRQALSDRNAVWGRFDVRISGASLLLPIVASMMNIRSRLTGIATGDQVIFMSREAYELAGGFPEQLLMEDIEMSRRLKKLSWPACLGSKVTTSGRRWDERGPIRTIFLMWSLRFLYWLGLSPERARRLYK